MGSFFTYFSPTRREYIITPSWNLDAHGLWTDRTKLTEMIYSFCDFLRLTMKRTKREKYNSMNKTYAWISYIYISILAT